MAALMQKSLKATGSRQAVAARPAVAPVMIAAPVVAMPAARAAALAPAREARMTVRCDPSPYNIICVAYPCKKGIRCAAVKGQMDAIKTRLASI